jgi:hypothetical protein
MDTRLNPSGQVPSCPSPGASPTTPRPITELDRLTGRRSWPLLLPRYGDSSIATRQLDRSPSNQGLSGGDWLLPESFDRIAELSAQFIG